MTSNSHPRKPRQAHAWLAIAASAALLLGTSVSAAAKPPTKPAAQQYRPLIHFTPEQNWMNDPNGLVYVDGTYHLFFQHNPQGNDWGNMSWGHATSPDLLTWTEQPIAIPQTFNADGGSVEDIFSGSVVVDTNNTSGFGVPGGPAPLIAIYTSAYTPAHPTLAGIQAQSLAYSTDNGATWTKYDNNPVLNRNSANFRDPKVFWYDGPAGSYWVMAAVEATEHRVLLYRSDNLRDWTELSSFGPANSTGGIWECPDLFEVPVDGDPNNTKWVMVVNLNPGAVNGGSGGQYFVGDFDGTTFTSESTATAEAPPVGDVFADFESGYGDWTVANEPGNATNGPFGTAPATGATDGQMAVTGFSGVALANSFVGQDWPVGSLTSPDFTITEPYLNFLVGGGNHPHVDGRQLGNEPPTGATLFDFELPDGENLSTTGWTLTGDFALEPNRTPTTSGGDYYLGTKRINTFESGPHGDDNTGEITSPTFTASGTFLSFLIGGGLRDDGTLEAQLLVDGAVERTATGADAGALNWASWDISEFAGRDVQIRLVDQATGGWGHLTFDHVVMGGEPATVRSDETSVNLVVDGEVVRTATGANSESLDWASWDVRDLAGKNAHIEVIDNNRFGWGHVLLDQVMFAPAPATSRLENYDWLDWGRDYYASVSYFGAPDGKRIMQGWMNNWDYAGDTPTPTWRSAMALPREVQLVSTPHGPRLAQHVVSQVDGILQEKRAKTRAAVALDGEVELGLSGETVKVDVTLTPGNATTAGITVFGNDTHGTRIGYNTETGRVFIDRTNSGATDFNANFASVEDAPVKLDADGRVTFEIYLDRASVELFTDGGRTTMTDIVFPDAGADAISAWSTGGVATLDSITVTPLLPTMWQPGATRAPGTKPATGPRGGAPGSNAHPRPSTPEGVGRPDGHSTTGDDARR